MKLLASDFDGTLFFGEEGISEHDVLAIEKWQAADNLFGIATGRGVANLRTQLPAAIKPDFIIGLNGAEIFYRDQQIRKAKIDNEVVQGIIKIIAKYEVDYSIASGDNHVQVLADRDNHLKHLEEMKVDELEKITNFVVSTDNFEMLEAIEKEIMNDYGYGVTTHRNQNRLIDITEKEVDKGTGVSLLAEAAGISKNNIYVVGDSYNDISMIKRFSGSTLTAADQEVKETASSIYQSVGDLIEAKI